MGLGCAFSSHSGAKSSVGISEYLLLPLGLILLVRFGFLCAFFFFFFFLIKIALSKMLLVLWDWKLFPPFLPTRGK